MSEYRYVWTSGRSGFPEATYTEGVYPVHVRSLNSTPHRDVAMYVTEATHSYRRFVREATPDEVAEFLR